MQDKIVGWTQTCYTVTYLECLSPDCDLAVLAIVPFHGDQVCQIILKSQYAGQINGPDMIMITQKHTHKNAHMDKVNATCLLSFHVIS